MSKERKYIKELKAHEVIHAPTKEIAEKLCEKFDELEITTSIGNKFTDKDFWSPFKEDTFFSPQEGTIGLLEDYKVSFETVKVYTIDQLKDFDQKGELKYDLSYIHDEIRDIEFLIENYNRFFDICEKANLHILSEEYLDKIKEKIKEI